jgi:hypothetical protein
MTSQREPESPDVALALRDLFTLLLKGFKVVAALSDPPRDSRKRRIRALLEGFKEVHESAVKKARVQAALGHERFRDLLMGYSGATENDRRHQEEHADGFNLLAVMRLTGKEIRHSMVLAWLLDHDVRRLGTHAQGSLGFRLFLKQFKLPSQYANCKYWVRREVAGDESIVDVEVACRGQFLIHIENKIWAAEGLDQTDREWEDLQRRATELGLNPETQGAPVHGLFLTPQGTKPKNPNFKSIRWGLVVRVLEAFSAQAKPIDVKLFASHYARAMRRFIVTQEVSEDEYGNGIAE